MVATLNLVLLPDAFHLIVVDYADGLSDKPTVADIVLSITIEVLDLVLVPRPYKRCAPCEVLRHDVLRVNRHLQTLVGGLTHIHKHIRETGDLRQITLQKKIVGSRSVEINVTIDAVVQDSKVNTDIKHLGRFPTQTSVTHASIRIESGRRRPIHRNGLIIHLSKGLIYANCLISSLTVRKTQLQIVQPVNVRHKLLVGDVPTNSH